MADRKPDWFKVRFVQNEASSKVSGLMAKHGLHSVCQSAKCPNRHECWASGTATFMVLGDFCTRACRFCAVKTMTNPPPPDQNEPKKLADAIAALQLQYAVITSVTRDDLSDGGAGHFAECVRELKKAMPELKVEVLVPDFGGNEDAIRKLAFCGADVIGHNVETVERLSSAIRDRRASYRQSLSVLHRYSEIVDEKIKIKSGFMVGLGESDDEIIKTMADLRDAGVEIITIGQYLRPSENARHVPVAEYIPPQKFKEYERVGYELGFRYVASCPFVRSSYRAAEAFTKARNSG